MIIIIGILLVICIIAGAFIVFSKKKDEEVVKQGVDYYQQKKYESHLEECIKVIEAEPNYTIAYYNAACCYSQLFKKKQAIEML